MRPPSPSIPEREFLLSALQESLRIDGRQMLENRTFSIDFGAELGWVECSLGKTKCASRSKKKTEDAHRFTFNTVFLFLFIASE
jgi:exosome complex RNA-binding protein Rrp42 (RNase PH superfamily)